MQQPHVSRSGQPLARRRLSPRPPAPALTPFLSEWTKTRPLTPSAKRTPRGRSTATKYSLSRIFPAGPPTPGSAPSAAAATLSLLHLRPLLQETEEECARALGGARGSAHPAPPRRPRAAAVAVMVRAGGVRRCRWGAMGAAQDGDRVRGGGERNGGHGIRGGVEWGWEVCGTELEAEAFGSLRGRAGRGSGTHAAAQLGFDIFPHRSARSDELITSGWGGLAGPVGRHPNR